MAIDSAAGGPSPSVAASMERLALWAQRARWPAIALFFLVAAVVQTWPLAKHLKSSITVWWFFPYDAWQSLWNLWWVKDRLLHFGNPFHTSELFYPQGSNLYLHPVTFVNGVMSMPFQLLTGNLVLSWNIVALISFVLSGVGAAALSYHVSRNHLAAVVSGFIFAFAPFTMMRFGGHYNIFITWPIPFMLLFLLRFRETGRLRDAAFTGVFWAVITLNWLEFATDAALFLALFFAYWSAVYFRRSDPAQLSVLWRGAGVLIVVWAVLSSPALIGSVRDLESGDYYQPTDQAESFSADLLTFFTPSPLWGPGDAPLIGGPNPNHLPVGSVEDTAFLGGTPLLLATIALVTLRKDRHRALIWVIALFTFAILAMGPYLYINDSRHHHLLGVSFSVPMPYQLYDKLPFFGSRRVPARMIVFGIMSLSVLAGIGLTTAMEWLKPRARYLAPAVAVVALGLVWLEYWSPPVYLTPLATPPGIDMIRDDPDDFTVVDAPLGRRNGWTYAGDPTGGPLANYYEALYHKPSIGGYLSRVKSEGFDWFLQQPGLHFLSCPSGCGGNGDAADQDKQAVQQVLRDNHIKYVIVHKLQPDGGGLFYIGEPEITAMTNYTRDVLGMEQVYDDYTLTIFRARDFS
ncbi:MAG TPA: hypothetical protein VMT90_06525 [Dehalococcoidia bacterium]|nr:hypothetical protein [Dehalococcoidia bacterium]